MLGSRWHGGHDQDKSLCHTSRDPTHHRSMSQCCISDELIATRELELIELEIAFWLNSAARGFSVKTVFDIMKQQWIIFGVFIVE